MQMGVDVKKQKWQTEVLCEIRWLLKEKATEKEVAIKRRAKKEAAEKERKELEAAQQAKREAEEAAAKVTRKMEGDIMFLHPFGFTGLRLSLTDSC